MRHHQIAASHLFPKPKLGPITSSLGSSCILPHSAQCRVYLHLHREPDTTRSGSIQDRHPATY